MRDTYLKILYELAKRDSNVVSLVCDNGLIIYDDFRRDFPDRYYNFGIAEANMVGAAAGMASCGKIPFVYTISAFIAYRAYEFLRDDVCFQNQNVKLIGIGSGLTYSTLGPSHHTTEDIGLLRSLPNLTVFSPATRAEVRWMMEEAYRIRGPVYIRLGNNNDEYYKENTEFSIGKPAVVKEGKDITIIATGLTVVASLEAAEMLEKDGISTKVINIPTIKPLDTELIISAAKETGKVITVEEHSVIGGLGSAVCECLCEKAPTPILRIGIQDTFGESGSATELLKKYGLSAEEIYKKAKEFQKNNK